MRGWLVTALLPPPWRAPPGAWGAFPPLGSTWAPCRGRGGGFADGSLGVRRIWWLLQCSHLMVPLCIIVCPVGARLTAVCGAALWPVALLLAFLPISGSFFFCWHAHCCWCAAPGGQHVAPCIPLWLSGCPTCSWVVGTRGTGRFCTCLQIYKPTCQWCLFSGECGALLLFCILGC